MILTGSTFTAPEPDYSLVFSIVAFLGEPLVFSPVYSGLASALSGIWSGKIGLSDIVKGLTSFYWTFVASITSLVEDFFLGGAFLLALTIFVIDFLG